MDVCSAISCQDSGYEKMLHDYELFKHSEL